MKRKYIADVSTAIPGVGRVGAGGTESEQVPALTVVSHPQARRAGDRALLPGLLAGRAAYISRNEPDFLAPGSVVGAPLVDPFLSRKPFVIAPTGDGGVRVSSAGSGTQLVMGELLGEADREIGLGELEAGVPIELAGRVVLLLHLAPATSEPADRLGMMGTGTALQAVRRHIEQVADLDVPVLIRGETGTGKELVARAIHQVGLRRQRRFVGVSLAALPKELAVAELFGVQKGAYTGAATDRQGYFRAASGGTLFLDEIGEAPHELQAMLLRALETGEVYPVGAQSPVILDVRLLAATDADLEARIGDGSFKAPLLHRLAGYEIWLPPLRQRREDIGRLFFHFARQELEQLGEAERLWPADPYAEPWLPASLAARLVCYPWPGNIRELRNLTRRLIIDSRGRPSLHASPRLMDQLEDAQPPPPGRAAPASPVLGASPGASGGARRKPADVSEDELVAAMRACAWDVKAAAEHLGISRSSLYDRITRSSRLRTAGDLSSEEITACFRACDGDLDAMVQRLEVSKRALKRRVRELGLHR